MWFKILNVCGWCFLKLYSYLLVLEREVTSSGLGNGNQRLPSLSELGIGWLWKQEEDDGSESTRDTPAGNVDRAMRAWAKAEKMDSSWVLPSFLRWIELCPAAVQACREMHLPASNLAEVGGSFIRWINVEVANQCGSDGSCCWRKNTWLQLICCQSTTNTCLGSSVAFPLPLLEGFKSWRSLGNSVPLLFLEPA